MALNIKDAETYQRARELAEATGETITVAVRVALTERLARVRARRDGAGHRAVVDAIMQRGRTRALIDDRTPEAIVGYDEDGLPA